MCVGAFYHVTGYERGVFYYIHYSDPFIVVYQLVELLLDPFVKVLGVIIWDTDRGCIPPRQGEEYPKTVLINIGTVYMHLPTRAQTHKGHDTCLYWACEIPESANAKSFQDCNNGQR